MIFFMENYKNIIIKIGIYIIYFCFSFLFATVIMSSMISFMFGDFNIWKNTLIAFRPKPDQILEDIQRKMIALKFLSYMKSKRD